APPLRSDEDLPQWTSASRPTSSPVALAGSSLCTKKHEGQARVGLDQESKTNSSTRTRSMATAHFLFQTLTNEARAPAHFSASATMPYGRGMVTERKTRPSSYVSATIARPRPDRCSWREEEEEGTHAKRCNHKKRLNPRWNLAP